MATVSDLKARDFQDVAYLFVVEGLPYAWSDKLPSDYLDGYGEGRTVRKGLLLPSSYTISLDIRSSPLIEGGHLEVGLIDEDHTTLVNLFGSSRDTTTLQQVGEPITPGMKTKAMEAIAGWGDSAPDIDARGKDIGIEHIGPDGERRYWWIFPDNPKKGIGLDHPVSEWQAASPIDTTLPPVFVSDDPYIFAGRKAVIYEVHKDDDGTWKSWADTYAGGGLLWFGTLRDEGRLDGLRTWRLKCDGPGSWLSKALNTSRPDVGFPASPRTNLASNERGVAVWFWRDSGVGDFDGYTYHDAILFVNDLASSDNTPQEIAEHVGTQVGLARDSGTGATDPSDTTGGAGNPTDGGAYADAASKGAASRWGFFSLNGASIKTGISGGTRGAMAICMHEKAWLACGWDPNVQPHHDDDDPRKVQFYSGHGSVQTVGHGTLNPPGPGYWVGVFTTDSPGETADRDNGGNDRHYSPQFPGGAMFLDGNGGQVVGIGIGTGPYMPGQNGYRPSAKAKI